MAPEALPNDTMPTDDLVPLSSNNPQKNLGTPTSRRRSPPSDDIGHPHSAKNCAHSPPLPARRRNSRIYSDGAGPCALPIGVPRRVLSPTSGGGRKRRLKIKMRSPEATDRGWQEEHDRTIRRDDDFISMHS